MKKLIFFVCFYFFTNLLSALSFEETVCQFQNLPKAEFHIHLGGAFPKEYLDTIATKQQKEALEKALIGVFEGETYSDVFPAFKVVAEIVDTEEKVQKGVESLCLNLQKEAVRYVEIRTGIKNLGKGYEEYLKAILNGIKAASSDDFQATVILSVRRNSSLEYVKETINLVRKYKDQSVTGIDISGDPTEEGSVENILAELVLAKEEGIPFVIHMGETQNEQDQMLLLENLEPKRIGHGVHLCKEAKQWILQKKIPIEVCLTSSVLAKMVNRYEQHPAIQYYKDGHPILFCTDDPLIFSTTLSKELALAYKYLDLSKEEIKQIVDQSMDHSL